MDVREINSLVLAYLGDCVYENYIRHFLVSKRIGNVNELQKSAVKYVSAKAQSDIVHKLIDEEFFNSEELDVFNRARNNKNHGHPKNCDIVTYKNATGFEAILGYLDFTNKQERISEIMERVVGD